MNLVIPSSYIYSFYDSLSKPNVSQEIKAVTIPLRRVPWCRLQIV